MESRHEPVNVRSRHRPSEEEALRSGAPNPLQPRELIVGLYALRRRIDTEGISHSDDRSDEG
jgi:hypothetical protein